MFSTKLTAVATTRDQALVSLSVNFSRYTNVVVVHTVHIQQDRRPLEK